MTSVKNFVYLLLLIAFTSLTAGTAFAETVSFQKEYTYQAGGLDNKGSARIIAMENAKRLLFGEVEAYLESKAVIKTFDSPKIRLRPLSL